MLANRIVLFSDDCFSIQAGTASRAGRVLDSFRTSTQSNTLAMANGDLPARLAP